MGGGDVYLDISGDGAESRCVNPFDDALAMFLSFSGMFQ